MEKTRRWPPMGLRRIRYRRAGSAAARRPALVGSCRCSLPLGKEASTAREPWGEWGGGGNTFGGAVRVLIGGPLLRRQFRDGRVRARSRRRSTPIRGASRSHPSGRSALVGLVGLIAALVRVLERSRTTRPSLVARGVMARTTRRRRCDPHPGRGVAGGCGRRTASLYGPAAGPPARARRPCSGPLGIRIVGSLTRRCCNAWARLGEAWR